MPYPHPPTEAEAVRVLLLLLLPAAADTFQSFALEKSDRKLRNLGARQETLVKCGGISIIIVPR